MITFIIEKNEKEINIECSLSDTILILKQKIINEFKLNCKYIDIDFLLDRPIRSLGKFNLESGILPRSLDNYNFDRYGLDDREIKATFHEIDNYDNKKYNRKFKHNNIFKKNIEKENLFDTDNIEDKSFDIESMDDFPTLGS